MHALIIEDELLLALSVEEALKKLGYCSFEIAVSVDQAIGAAGQRWPDLIVANHRITGGTGTDAVLAICCDKAAPVVFVTSSGPEVRERLPGALVVQKPIKLTLLQTAVSTAVERPFRRSPDPGAPTWRIVE